MRTEAMTEAEHINAMALHVLGLYDAEVILAAATKIMQSRGRVTVELKTQNGFTQCAVNDYAAVFGPHRKEGESINLYALPLQVKE